MAVDVINRVLYLLIKYSTNVYVNMLVDDDNERSTC